MSEFNKQFAFKDIPLNEMSYARRTLMLSIMGDSDVPKIARMHGCLYALACDPKEAKAAFRGIGKFIDDSMEWAERKGITENDLEAEGNLIRDINEHASKTKVEEVPDESLTADPPTGN